MASNPLFYQLLLIALVLLCLLVHVGLPDNLCFARKVCHFAMKGLPLGVPETVVYDLFREFS